jgi:hypothetical protein
LRLVAIGLVAIGVVAIGLGWQLWLLLRTRFGISLARDFANKSPKLRFRACARDEAQKDKGVDKHG